MRLEALNIEICYQNLKDEERLTVIEPLTLREWGEYSFCIKDPVGNWVEIYQSAEAYADGRGFLTPKRRHNDKKPDVRLTLWPYFKDCKHTVDAVKGIDITGFSSL